MRECIFHTRLNNQSDHDCFLEERRGFVLPTVQTKDNSPLLLSTGPVNIWPNSQNTLKRSLYLAPHLLFSTFGRGRRFSNPGSSHRKTSQYFTVDLHGCISPAQVGRVYKESKDSDVAEKNHLNLDSDA